jgi:hypothetical protein
MEALAVLARLSIIRRGRGAAASRLALFHVCPGGKGNFMRLTLVSVSSRRIERDFFKLLSIFLACGAPHLAVVQRALGLTEDICRSYCKLVTWTQTLSY